MLEVAHDVGNDWCDVEQLKTDVIMTELSIIWLSGVVDVITDFNY